MTKPDVVVIGSGPCGAIAARELVNLGLDVTTLDAGLRPVRGVIVRAAGNTVFKWGEPRGLRANRQVAVGDPATTWISSLSLGGLSNYWSGAVPRMGPDDFTEGAALGERFRWPISYNDVAPFYEIVEKAMFVTAGAPIVGLPPNAAANYVGLDEAWQEFTDRAAVNGDPIGAIPLAKGRPWMVALRPTGFNAYHCLLKPLRHHARFRIVAGACAVHIDPRSGHPGEALVTYVDRTTKEHRTLHSRAVVVAAGALDSTRLLLQSRSDDFPCGLGNAGGLVGRYLHDHAKQWWPARLARPMPLLTHPLYIPRLPIGNAEPLMASSLTLGMVGATARLRAWSGAKSDLVGVQVLGTMVPSHEYTVRLPSGPPADDPIDDPLEVCIRYDDQTLKNMETARDRFAEIFDQAGLRAVPQGPFHQMLPGGSVHYGGTVRMHKDREFGVLDEWNRVFDAPNVIVCDASCFTTGPEKNPTLTAMAIAARAAHRLAADLADRPTSTAVR